MEPLSATVVAIVTGVISKGVAGLAKQVGEAASNVAQTLAQAVLDRLRQDPLEQRTVERYEEDPVGQQASVEAAIGDQLANDDAFAARLQELVKAYEDARAASGIAIGGDVDGNVVQGDENVVVKTNTGTIRYGTGPD